MPTPLNKTPDKQRTSNDAHFQKILIPTLRKVNGNSKAEGWRGFKLKNLPREGYGYFLEQHNRHFTFDLSGAVCEPEAFSMN